MTTLPNLRPMNIGDLLDAAFRLYRKHFLSFIGIAALLQVPMLILQIVLQFVITGDAFADILNFSNSPPVIVPGQNPLDILPITSFITVYVVSLLIGLIQYLLVYNLITGALSKAIARSYTGEPISILNSYAIGWRPFFSLVAASIIPYIASLLILVPIFGVSVAVIVSLTTQGNGNAIWITVLLVLALIGISIALVLGLFVLYVRFLLTTQSIVLEKTGPLRSLGRSWDLTRGSFWRSLVLFIMMSIIAYTISVLPASGISMAIQLTSGSPEAILRGTVISSVVSQVGLILALPLQLSVYTLLYYDLRIRREGYDIELQAQQVALS